MLVHDGRLNSCSACLLALVPLEQVFFGSDFVTVTKSEDYSWAVRCAPCLLCPSCCAVVLLRRRAPRSAAFSH